MRILLIEDSKRLQNSLTAGLRRSGFAVDSAIDGEEGLWLAQSNDYDVIVLDLMIPKMDGLSVLRKLRECGRSAHVLILSAKDSTPDKIAGLDCGADDYLAKPFDFDELVARLRALARRSHQSKNPLVDLGRLQIDTVARNVFRDGQKIELTPREYALLEYLVFRRNQVVSRTEIEAHIYDDRVEPMSNVVDAAICILRRKIDPPGESSMIQTRRGMGYVLHAPEVAAAPE